MTFQETMNNADNSHKKTRGILRKILSRLPKSGGKVEKFTVSTSNYSGESTLQDIFLKGLQEIVDNGGQVISITGDATRHKSAYVIRA